MSNEAGTGRPANFSQRSRVALIALSILSMVAVLLTVSATTQTAEAQGSLPAGTTCFAFDESDDGSNAATHVSYLHTIVDGTSTTAATASITGNVENIAVRNDAGEIYAYDAGGQGATDQLYGVDPATGAFGPPNDFGLSALGDVDAMFFVNDENGDPTDDVLWVLVDPNVLTGYDLNGVVVGGPVTVAVPAGEGIEGATWLAEPAPGEFFIHYTVTGSAAPSVMASLGTGTTPLSTPANIGTTEPDVEGFGTDGAGNLYLTTGGDSTDSLYSVTTGASSALLVDLAAGAPADGSDDFESVDCSTADIDLVKTVTAGPIDNGDGTFGYEFTFTVTNTGHEPLENIVLTDDYVFTPAGVTATNLVNVTNSCGGTLLINAQCVIVDTVDLAAAPGDYNNAAVVDAVGVFGQPVTDPSNVDFTIPAIGLPQLEIVKTVVPTGTTCPVPGTPGDDRIQAATGTPVIYCITVTNSGAGDAINVSVLDSLTGATETIGALAAGASSSYQFDYTVAAEPETNTATVSGQAVDGTDAPGNGASDLAGTDAVPQPQLEIVKTVVAAGAACPVPGIPGDDRIVAATGTAVTYCITVTNSGAGDAINVSVLDSLTGATETIGGLAAGASSSYQFDYTVAAEPETNTATVSGQAINGVTAPGDGTSDLAGTDAPIVIPVPVLQIVKSVVPSNGTCPADYAAAVAAGLLDLDTIPNGGEVVRYCISVINNGPGTAFNVTVADDFNGAQPQNIGTLTEGAGSSFTYLHTAAATAETNTATVNGENSEGTATAPDSDTAGTTPPPPDDPPVIEIIKTVVAANAACPGSFAAAAPNDGAPTDTITAAVGDFVKYCINVLNSGTGTAVNTTVTDAQDPNTPRVFATIPPDGQVAFSYTIAVTASPNTNVANVTADDTNGNTNVTSDNDDAGVTPPVVDPVGAIGNYVWLDSDGDGIQDVGAGVQGVTVTVTGPSGTLTTTTAADGSWLIDNLIPGDYTVSFTDPLGRSWTVAEAGDDTNDSDATATGAAGVHTVVANATNDTVDAGLIPPVQPVGALGNFVWLDSDQDGIQDAGAGVAGVTVTATGPSGTLTTTTAADGSWLIGDLIPGAYTVTFTDPQGRSWTVAEAGDDTNDSDANSAGAAGVHTVVANATNDTVDAGLVPELGALGNFIWLDSDLDGIQDAAAGVQGVTVTATGPSGTLTTTTAADGSWLIDDLLPGDYTVQFTDPLGRTWTVAEAGDDTNDSDADPATGAAGVHTVVANATNDTVDGGLIPPVDPVGALGNFVWLDSDQDGIQDAAAGVAGVTVTATGPSGTLTTTTAADGSWLIGDLIPGAYTVTFTDPQGRDFTIAEAGDDTNDSDAGVNGSAGTHIVVANATNDTVDAGLVPPPVVELGALGNFVWLDSDRDGIQDAAAGVAGVTVTATGPSGTLTTTTAADGSWLIDNLIPGAYTVTFTDPQGRDWTIAEAGDDTNDSDAGVNGSAGTHIVVANATNDTVDAGLVPPPIATPPGALGNFIWLDNDGDGIQDADEPGVAGVTVTATGPSGTLTAVTAADGSWLIDGLVPGVYSVTFNDPLGRDWTVTGAGSGTNDSDAGASGAAGNHVVVSNQTNDTVDGGLIPPPIATPPGALGNYIWLDNDGDGIQDADEPGVAGVTVTATGPSGTLTAVTAADGSWNIPNLVPGAYTVTFNDPQGRDWTVTGAGDGTNDSDAGATGAAGTHIVVSNQLNDTVDGGLIPPPIATPPGALGNYIWLDNDGDGIQDADEPGVAGVTVTATGPSGTLTAVTAADGSWTIPNLVPGAYTVTFNDPAGRTWTTTGAGDGTNDSDAGVTGAAGTHIVVSNQTNDTVDGGLLPPTVPPATGSIGNYVWLDNNMDGIQDADEPGVAGVTVTVTGPSGTLTTVTAADGSWNIANLDAGAYTVTFTDPDGRTWTTTRAGDGTNDSDAGVTGAAGTHVVSAGLNNDTVDAGLLPPTVPPAKGAIGNLVFDDLNGDGVQDPGEPGVSGVTVTVAGPSGTFTTVTNVNGEWSVTGLDAGDYSVVFTAPNGREWTLQDATAATDATDSDAGATGNAGVHPVVAGATNNDVDAGLAPVPPAKATLSDYVWIDANADGIQQATEAPVPGATVNIWSVNADGTPNAIIATVVTDANGLYTSGPLDAGDYIVQFTTPAGHYPTVQGTGGALDSNPNADGLTGVITLAAGENNDTIDAGFVPLGSLGNFIFNDANSNGVQDTGEVAVPGATVTLLNAAGTVIDTAVTGANGEYLFSGLRAGDYTVTLAPPSGFNLTTANAGGNDALDSDFNVSTGQTTVTLGAGQNIDDIDGGVVPKPVDPVDPKPQPPVVMQPEYPGPFKVVPKVATTPFTAKAPIPSAPVKSAPLAHTGSQAGTLATLAIALVGAGGLLLIGARREEELED